MQGENYPKVYLYRRIVKAKLFIDENFAGDIDLDHIADEAFFSKFHFIRLFKNAYAKTPHQYLTFVRIERSKLLLKEGKSVAEVCYTVGFDSISSFTGLFKRLTGQTPSAYQQLQQKIKEEIKTTPLKHIPNCFAEMKGWTQNSNFEEVRS
ncbi:helix-turn-helix domain-containing protein [Mucilaginibacter ginsenosidivorans]|uniref:Helix-turn-helix transcriptional regulator n=1 Tax=Mucilaginibacter ginsenosidivorans TaxID=398053 RepID=A0A5B8UTX8_9SPHI|nr:AraC family transcriptional regulator [Mucilaginibacter ginsenosidivorans]QEC62205.1 helix-turn-helix transcriptional regulator [Mucilaginibacter ginsenosidivorans]